MLIAFVFAFTAPAADYQWPLDLPRQLSSSFGEYRAGRLHAGIDLRTAGTGRTVVAAESGQVTRVRCSPYGYGKAVYIRFLDGNTAVYAHLESFAEPIGEYVRRAQHARRSYTVDLYPSDGDLSIERGQTIARSGQTGVGVPHLHYEIRDAAGRPINPHSLGIDWPDITPPTIDALLIAPLTPDSRVNGDVVPLIVPARKSGGLFIVDNVHATGMIGLGVELVDPANSGASKLGVRSLSTWVNDEEHFRMTRDRLSYDTLNNGLVAYHPYLYDRGRFLLQWRWPGNRSEPFAYAGGDGRIHLRAGPLSVRLTAADFHDNEASVQFEVDEESDSSQLNTVGDSSGIGTFDLACYGDFLVLTAEFSLPEHAAPTLTVNGGTGTFFRVDAKTFRAAIAPDAKAQRLVVEAAHPRAERFSALVDVFWRGDEARAVQIRNARLEVAPASPYGVLFAQSVEPGPIPPHDSLELVTNPIAVWPDNAPIDENIRLTIPLPLGETRQRQLGIYRAGRTGWSLVNSSETDGGLAVSTGSFGTYAAFADETPPRIGPVEIAGSKPRPRIRIPVRDVGSGIESYEVTSGGDWLLTAYDPERNILEWERDRDLPATAASVEVRVTDAAGNTAALSHPL